MNGRNIPGVGFPEIRPLPTFLKMDFFFFNLFIFGCFGSLMLPGLFSSSVHGLLVAEHGALVVAVYGLNSSAPGL